MSKKSIGLLMHIPLWIGVWLFYLYFFSYNSDNQYFIIVFASALVPITIAATYIHIYYLIPKFLLVQRYWKFTLYGIYTFVFTSHFILLSTLAGLMFLSDFVYIDLPPMSRNYSFIIILVYLVVAILSFIRILQSNAKIAESNQALENKLLSNQLEFKMQELAFLKKQIHPHFLFNTLNSIYGHALKSSKETPDLIIKLSNLLDYILYQVDKPKVLLSQEIAHIEEYISLEEIRQSDDLVIVFKKEIDQDIEIPPMLLLPFIENSFKHGRPINGIFSIDIYLEASSAFLDLKISNSHAQTNRPLGPSGIGLGNIEKRLDILYPDKYEHICTDCPEKYSVHLHINFS